MTRFLIVLVLAAGDGLRLLGPTGASKIPKQFRRLLGPPSMLRRTVRRARKLAPTRIVPVVQAAHARWWAAQLAGLVPFEHIVVQARNLGTAIGILLPLLLLKRAVGGDAIILTLPTDQHCALEPVLLRALRQSVRAAAGEPAPIVLLGMSGVDPDPGYGWIEHSPVAGADGTYPVIRFTEKPDAATAERLAAAGALANGFLLAGPIRQLLTLYERALPAAVATLDAAIDQGAHALAGAFATLPSADFSKEVLEPAVATLRVLRVPPCGWIDLGSPPRLARCRAHLGLARGNRTQETLA